MKKKFAFFILLSTLVLYGASSQQLKSYSDYRNGFAGLASAKYQGMIYSINIDAHISQLKTLAYSGQNGTSNPFHVSKLTEEQRFLMWSALNEYNYSEDEVYDIYIQTGSVILLLVVQFGKNGNLWYDGYGAHHF